MNHLSLILCFCLAPLYANDTKVGVYDSRSVAVAFAGSGAFNKWMAPLYEEMKKAKAAEDQEKITKLKAQGKARQKTLHTQAFNGAPVIDILAHIEDKLPEIKKKAGVTVLISKWDQKGLAQHKGAPQTDVTMALVDAFKPSKKQRKSAVDIQKKKPIPLKK